MVSQDLVISRMPKPLDPALPLIADLPPSKSITDSLPLTSRTCNQICDGPSPGNLHSQLIPLTTYPSECRLSPSTTEKLAKRLERHAQEFYHFHGDALQIGYACLDGFQVVLVFEPGIRLILKREKLSLVREVPQ